MNSVMVYMTAENMEQAESIGRVLVETKLAACVNILDNMRSMYWWEGKVEQAKEVVVLAKTRTDLVDELIEAVKHVHSYEVPCIATMPLVGGNPDFLTWIAEETR